MSEHSKVLTGVGKRRNKTAFGWESDELQDNGEKCVQNLVAKNDSRSPSNDNFAQRVESGTISAKIDEMRLNIENNKLKRESTVEYNSTTKIRTHLGESNLAAQNSSGQTSQNAQLQNHESAGKPKSRYNNNPKHLNRDTEQKEEFLPTYGSFSKNKRRKSASKEHNWEQQQLKNSLKGEGTDEIHIDSAKKYDYVFDETLTVDFTNQSDDETEEQDTTDGLKQNFLKEVDKEEERLALISESRKSLPVYHYRSQLMQAIDKNQILIIVGETGSGKTTQLPQYLVEDGYTQNGKYQVAVTQPRRVAATSVALRVADEMGVQIGQEVGYSIRFEDKTTPKTILKYMTDGMLLREFLTDMSLSKYSCIMIDEAHERTLATDILLGLLHHILPKRKDLKLLISSATMNAEKFSKFFFDCPIFNVPGRRFPVDIHYTVQPESNYIHAAITTIFQIHTSQELPGDILVFLTGKEEIDSTKAKIDNICHRLGSNITELLVTPIYANLPQEQQEKIFQKTPENCRKVVLATNIAETSLTIDGIKFVIDSGFVKENSYVPSTGMSQLTVMPCSKASVDQRAGRAGRVGPGKCFRLFTKHSYLNDLELMPKPEIMRTNIANIVLLLLSFGITNLIDFPFLDKPSIPTISKSLQILYMLGALNNKGSITKLGRLMCEFPCEPQFAKVLHSSATDPRCAGALSECVTIIAMLHETSALFTANARDVMKSIVGEVSSDHLLYLEIYNQWVNSNYSRSWCKDHKVQYKNLSRVRNIRKQLWNCSERMGLIEQNRKAQKEPNYAQQDSQVRIAKAFLSGFPMNVAKLATSGYKTIGLKSTSGLKVAIHPSSVVFQNCKQDAKKPPKYILYQQLVLTSREFVRVCMPIANEVWMAEMVPQIFTKTTESNK